MIKLEPAIFDNLSEEEISRTHEILRYAYAITEIEIWGENYSRVSIDEFKELIRRQEIILARIENIIIGSIHTFKLNTDTFSFGLLSVDFEQKGNGIGRMLISAAEQRAIDSGASFMDLEILKSRDTEVPIKKVLHDWYLRLGYVYTDTFSFIERKPDKQEKAKSLIAPAVFDCYRKRLKAG